MSISKLNNISWSSIVKVDGIAKASIAKVSGESTVAIQTATLSATKYAWYIVENTSWSLAVNEISAGNVYSSSLNINSSVIPTKGFSLYHNHRMNLQFDLSSYSTSSILSATLLLDVNSITTTATPNQVYVLDLGGATFIFPIPSPFDPSGYTAARANYSLVYQSGSLTEYATDTINNTGLHELNFSAAAITTANTHPSVYSMALLTYHDRNDIAPSLYNQYLVQLGSIPQLKITYQ